MSNHPFLSNLTQLESHYLQKVQLMEQQIISLKQENSCLKVQNLEQQQKFDNLQKLKEIDSQKLKQQELEVLKMNQQISQLNKVIQEQNKICWRFVKEKETQINPINNPLKISIIKSEEAEKDLKLQRQINKNLAKEMEYFGGSGEKTNPKKLHIQF